MSDPVLDALRRNLANSDPDSQADKVKRIKARIAELEKGDKAPAALPMALSPEPTAAPAGLGATVTPNKSTAEKAAARKKK